MHPGLQTIAMQLNQTPVDERLRFSFALACVQEVSSNLEDPQAIELFEQFQSCVQQWGPDAPQSLKALADRLEVVARGHPGSKSIDGTRHAAVSATHALAKAAKGQALEAAAYAAYSQVYGYGGYAVNDPDAFTEVHQLQLELLRHIQQDTTSKVSRLQIPTEQEDLVITAAALNDPDAQPLSCQQLAAMKPMSALRRQFMPQKNQPTDE